MWLHNDQLYCSLLVTNHLDLIDLCRRNEVILFCLLPHTTHALPPLNVAVISGSFVNTC